MSIRRICHNLGFIGFLFLSNQAAYSWSAADRILENAEPPILSVPLQNEAIVYHWTDNPYADENPIAYLENELDEENIEACNQNLRKPWTLRGLVRKMENSVAGCGLYTASSPFMSRNSWKGSSALLAIPVKKGAVFGVDETTFGEASDGDTLESRLPLIFSDISAFIWQWTPAYFQNSTRGIHGIIFRDDKFLDISRAQKVTFDKSHEVNNRLRAIDTITYNREWITREEVEGATYVEFVLNLLKVYPDLYSKIYRVQQFSWGQNFGDELTKEQLASILRLQLISAPTKQAIGAYQNLYDQGFFSKPSDPAWEAMTKDMSHVLAWLYSNLDPRTPWEWMDSWSWEASDYVKQPIKKLTTLLVAMNYLNPKRINQIDDSTNRKIIFEFLAEDFIEHPEHQIFKKVFKDFVYFERKMMSRALESQLGIYQPVVEQK